MRTNTLRNVKALTLALALSGCTIVGGTIGGMSARSQNRSAREAGKPENASAGARIVVGALVGLVVDLYLASKSLEDCCPDFENNDRR